MRPLQLATCLLLAVLGAAAATQQAATPISATSQNSSSGSVTAVTKGSAAPLRRLDERMRLVAAALPRLAVKALFLYTYAALSALYVLALVRRLAPGRPRCLAVAPVVVANLVVPLVLDHVTEPLLVTPVGGIFSLAAFKLLAFALGRGPLTPDWLSPLQFCGVLLAPVIPIEVFTVGSQDTARRHVVKHGRQLLLDSWRSLDARTWGRRDVRVCVGVGLLVTWVLAVPGIPVMARHWLYTLCSATFLTAVFDLLAAAAHASFGIASAPSFDRPWLSCSFQDFWARRWNLTTTYMMRVLVYEPVMQGSLLPPPAEGPPPPAAAPPTAAAAQPPASPAAVPPAAPAHAPHSAEQRQRLEEGKQERLEGGEQEGKQPAEQSSDDAAAAAAPAGPAEAAAVAEQAVEGGSEQRGSGLRRRRLVGGESAPARGKEDGEPAGGIKAKTQQLKEALTNGPVGANGSSSGSSSGRRATLLRRFLALQAVFLFSGLWHILIFWYNTRVFSWKWAAFFTVQAPILMLERALHKLGARLGIRVPHALQVFSANFLLIVVARPLFFGPADDTGFAQRNLAVGQAPLWAVVDWLAHLRAAAGQQQQQHPQQQQKA
ncbi:hypothetical protein HXX76_012686 [Chlamydomonas incerta]|uniref:Wax synthase domain-containing protein n=1 Tax=Chlamydomonas incerta TaxID=51695 RepID=A0A835VVD0_CHLIN|nr:hypothetical protein HXX76_012686 [Chlamydomonas incerta]|eukprot:KAG2426899.1 hypothetical protein HXX76_012686 [Chlamydomonas incerta]